MDGGNSLIVGYDFGNERTQISCLARRSPEPEMSGRDTKTYVVPTVLNTRSDNDEWLFGEEALKARSGHHIDNLVDMLRTGEDILVRGVKMSPEYVVSKFFQKTLNMLRRKYQNDGIAMMVIALKETDGGLVEKLHAILDKLGIKNDRVSIMSYTECFMYYTLSQKQDIWANDVGLFAFGKEGFHYYQMTIGKRNKPYPVLVNHRDLSDEFPYSLLKDESPERVRYRLEDVIQRLLYKKSISALYFTGYGFEGDWTDEVLRRLCVGRRVFKGQNLYTMGACHASRILHSGSVGIEGFQFINENDIVGNIYMKAYKDSKDSLVTFAKTGDDYHHADKTIRVILDDENTLDFTINSMVRRDDINAFLTLNGLVRRKDKTACVMVNLRFVDRNTAVVTVRDMGFGDITAKTYQVWEFRLEL